MSKQKLETVIFQIRIKRCSELEESLKREVVFVELHCTGQKEGDSGKVTKKKKLWKTPLVEVNARRTAGFGKPLYPMFLLQRKVPPPGSNLKPDPLEITFKLRHVQGGKKSKKITAWKMNIMRFYKVTENINTVLFKDENGPRITLNVVDITELKRQNGGNSSQGNGTEGSSEFISEEEEKKKKDKGKHKRLSINFHKKKKKQKVDEHGLPIEDGSESVSESVSMSDYDTDSSMSMSENRFDQEAASESDAGTDLSQINLRNAVDFDESEQAYGDNSDDDDQTGGDPTEQFSLKSIVQTEGFDVMYKVIVIGDSGVGKSSVLGRWTRDDFSLSLSSTIHVELSAKSFKVDNKVVKVQFWDTAGQERFNAITRQYYRGAQGAVLVYDITNRNSFTSIARWLGEVREVNPDVVLLMVGNKSDLDNERNHLRQVPTKEALEYSHHEGIAFLETSALNGTNCVRAMQQILQEIHSISDKKTKTKLNTRSTNSTTPVVPTKTQTVNLTAPPTTTTTTNTNTKDPEKCAC
eukprot:TRINITY_DN424_c3_g1_i1.p1 TRINITY_DN424_c3_g1~~TRINITY_DN424_c3_g1_i1.p1  ORF type:complete len:542 (+),score=111.50 TRINITY_DN424_c3_g1_i1:57-1628(+)